MSQAPQIMARHRTEAAAPVAGRRRLPSAVRPNLKQLLLSDEAHTNDLPVRPRGQACRRPIP